VGLDVVALVAVAELGALDPLGDEAGAGRDPARRGVVDAVPELQAEPVALEGPGSGGGQRR